MKENFELFFKNLMAKEGYYSNHEWDVGGETLFGVSRRYHPDWLGWRIFDTYNSMEEGIPDKDKMFTRLESELKSFYKNKFWDNVKADELPSGLDLLASDCSVNPGESWARKALQKAVQAFPDGIIGPKTIFKANQTPINFSLGSLHDQRSVYYAVESNPRTRKVALAGWIARNRSVYTASKEISLV